MTKDEAVKKMQAVKFYMTDGNPIRSFEEMGEAFDMAIDALEQPERKPGKWIHDGCDFEGGIDWMHCSACGHKDVWSGVTRTPFCGWCGAKMGASHE